MRTSIFRTIKTFTFIAALTAICSSVAFTQNIRSAAGASPAAIQATVDQFRMDLGGTNNGVGGTFTTGRREINWDGVPDSASAPNLMPANFFNVNSPRGVLFNSIPDGGSTGQISTANFFVSATTASGTPVRFGNINPTYSTIFQTFSAQRLFTPDRTKLMEINFFIPGTNIPATVSGFGVVFCDVDNGGGPNATTITVFKTDGTSLLFVPQPADNGLSFAGISFNDGVRISRVIISSGTGQLDAATADGSNGIDIVAMDDFIYGEPRARDYHRGDFDGDGQSDSVVFRPSNGTWFITRSGSGTTDIAQFGQNGDIPVEGDFDGDKLADLAVFRPSEGGWYIRRSSNGTFITQAFGAPGDKPVAGDYDRDGITDLAIWRPSNGNYFVLRSSTGLSTFFAFPFGVSGDIPLLAGPQ